MKADRRLLRTLAIDMWWIRRLESVLYSLTAVSKELLALRQPALAQLQAAASWASSACTKVGDVWAATQKNSISGKWKHIYANIYVILFLFERVERVINGHSKCFFLEQKKTHNNDTAAWQLTPNGCVIGVSWTSGVHLLFTLALCKNPFNSWHNRDF